MPGLRVRKALEDAGLGYDKSASSPKGSTTKRENERIAAEVLAISGNADAEEAHDAITHYFSHIFSADGTPRNIKSTSLVPLFVYLKLIKGKGKHQQLRIANHGQLMRASEIADIAGCQKAWRRSHLHIGEYCLPLMHILLNSIFRVEVCCRQGNLYASG